MGKIDMIKMMFTPAPSWKKDVETKGTPAQAVVTSNPGDITQGIGGYQGRDGWVSVDVMVEPGGGQPYPGKMKCQLSTSMLLTQGMKVDIRFDPKDQSKILLMDDINQIIGHMVKPH